jgi:hypothetical protein
MKKDLRDLEAMKRDLFATVVTGDNVLPILILASADGPIIGLVSPFEDPKDLEPILERCLERCRSGEHYRDRVAVKP